MRSPIAAPFTYALLAFAAPGLATPAAPTTSSASSTAGNKSGPRSEAAWIRLNPVPGRPSAGYLIVRGGAKADRIIGATAPGARIEMHSMSMAGGVMSMARMDAAPVPAGGSIAFAPGGNHLMIFGLSGRPKSLPITLNFASGAKVTVAAEVRAADAAPAAGPHDGH